ncbi:MAG: flagellar motor protein MotB [Lachnospiraceae bacterium]|jgi:chemotaxis protein MotB|nr:flagellar motor protein MotB [Lachnospiraceae bacterium]
MARKKKEPDGGPGQPWLNTFADLMNLLLCFFVLLFASSSVDEKKFDEIAASFTSTFSIFQAGSTAIGDGILISNGVSQLNELDKYINSTGAMAENDLDADQFDSEQNEAEKELSDSLEEIEKAKLERSEQLAEQIEEALSENNIADKVEIDFNSQYVQLSLKGAILFNPGSADIADSIVPTLKKVGMILEKYARYEIEIEGHTDNVPERSKRFANNDELSSARALSVFYFFKENTNLDPAMMKHTGRGEYMPIADNSTSEGRDRNRRVEIKIYHELSNY